MHAHASRCLFGRLQTALLCQCKKGESWTEPWLFFSSCDAALNYKQICWFLSSKGLLTNAVPQCFSSETRPLNSCFDWRKIMWAHIALLKRMFNFLLFPSFSCTLTFSTASSVPPCMPATQIQPSWNRCPCWMHECKVRNLFCIHSLTTDKIPWTCGWTCNQSSTTTAANLAIHQSWHHNRNTNTMWIHKRQFFVVHHRRWKMATPAVTCPKLAENKRHGDQQEDIAEQTEDSPVDLGRKPCSGNENVTSCAFGAVKSSLLSLNSRARVWKWSTEKSINLLFLTVFSRSVRRRVEVDSTKKAFSDQWDITGEKKETI